MSGQEWDLVAEQYSRFHPDLDRTAEQFEKKFIKLSNTRC
jgi:hypothetical protein